MLRVKMNQNDTNLIPYNETTESTLFKDESADYTLEFAKNKLLVTFDSYMYLVVDWFVVKCIADPITSNTLKT